MFILASASPRRKELLSSIVREFTIVPSTEEEVPTGNTPKEIVLSLARQKANSIAKRYPNACVLGADTIVVYGDRILGKPTSKEDAFQTLTTLRGKDHSVFTGVCLVKDGKEYASVEESIVRIRNLSDEEITSYIESGSPMDKAGSYGIQDEGIVSFYRGSYTNVVGLPIETVKDLLKQAEENYE